MPDRIEVRAVRNGGRDHIEVPTASEAQAAALLRERAGYVMRGLPERVAAVDAELSRLGINPPTDQTDTPQTGADNDGNQQGRRTRRAGAKPGGRGTAAASQ
ncbi:MAG TPA: hypothetical protein VFR67_05905 [Pilimelia sp.]|nr:hypothetical protein [Pilimelia sp.]